uniref:Uncharacterized protein n=1 Tax=Anguilla anguilla TaxID=7936 RepID=A0A0E9Y1A8_ANGAN
MHFFIGPRRGEFHRRQCTLSMSHLYNFKIIK